jgi:cytochrome c-type biogenesis protein CcmH
MIILYVLLAMMLLAALGLLSLPFIKHRQVFSTTFATLLLLTACAAVELYWHSTDTKALRQWESQGRAHYDLMIKLNQLGGVEGMVKRIKQKLQANPNDAYGWFILGKLYVYEQDFPNAKAALIKAHDLNPNNPQINSFYQYILKN